MVTGIDMTGLLDSDVRAAWLRPDGTAPIPQPSIPNGDRVDIETGSVNIVVPQGLFTQEGMYILQVVVKLVGGIVASRHIEFLVTTGAVSDIGSVFA
jgi:hypothetical protein